MKWTVTPNKHFRSFLDLYYISDDHITDWEEEEEEEEGDRWLVAVCIGYKLHGHSGSMPVTSRRS